MPMVNAKAEEDVTMKKVHNLFFLPLPIFLPQNNKIVKKKQQIVIKKNPEEQTKNYFTLGTIISDSKSDNSFLPEALNCDSIFILFNNLSR